ncbi:MAG: aminotransferase class III-fold pyridoxal phosphate-dependent enzyme [Candidatus Binatus sp.]|uniref:aspartate aminotransferase family protein n=1 Tax=Candidatus Binatus sp. TaxID=2811406 RepID=UPI00272421F7|nr:aminotransferase class III-fold pyridoxal phosphate-dependent enzyme [Candidatus Binatus sp.]MDO8431244.1 aminotransferase class III-fold pyridoxal phosphate-dependent enzyme [Candidatus Binatus sp.]
MKPYTFEQSEALMQRAKKVVPGGIYGHQTPLLLTRGAYPSFFARGEGSHIWDVDGNEYIDYMCSYGPIVLGHRHPKVEEAAARQMNLGSCFNAPGPVWVELAEHLVSITPFADWTVFGKNGSDVCTWATEVARHATGRSKIAMCAGAYHGAHAWCTPVPSGVTPEDRANMVYFRYNELESLRQAVDENRGKIAGVILSPFKHDAGHDSELPVEGFLSGVRTICDDNGIVFILDDVRAGFRLHMGGSGELFGVRPDLSTYCKAIANGYPLSACLGRDSLKQAAQEVFFTGSYFTSAEPMAASLATLKELQASNGIERMRTIGEMLRAGLLEQARGAGLEVVYSGPPSLPYMTFKADAGHFDRAKVFCGECSRNGVYFAPRHNWFISAAHTERDIEQTLNVTERAFKVVRDQFGA